MFLETEEAVSKKKVNIYKPPTPEMLAYLDFSVNSNGLLTGVKVCEMLWNVCRLEWFRFQTICLIIACQILFVATKAPNPSGNTPTPLFTIIKREMCELM